MARFRIGDEMEKETWITVNFLCPELKVQLHIDAKHGILNAYINGEQIDYDYLRIVERIGE